MAGATHDLTVTLVPHDGRLSGRDRITVDAGSSVKLQLNRALVVQRVRAGPRALVFERRGGELDVHLPPGAASFEVEYAGRIADSGQPPQVADASTWLPGESAWFPRQDDGDAVTATVVTPAGQRAVLTGELLAEQLGPRRNRATFRGYPGQSPTLFAGPYVVTQRMHRGLRLRTYFPAAAQDLAAAYLGDVARHIDDFSALIGPYPYRGFAVVAAEQGVGYGYPGATYVSRQILPLPFMRAQSLAHEILHDWWGNSVAVAPGSGNWAEGLTTYMADYRMSQPGDRARMRREWLRDYTAMPAAQDQPLSAFAGRVHTRDLVVGYGKGAFVFLMLQDLIGRDAFDRGVAAFYRRFRGRDAGWGDLREAFEQASGRDLAGFFRQWIDATGAADLALSGVHFDAAGVRFTLAQAGRAYALQVPVSVRTASGLEQHVVALDQPRQSFDVRTAARPLQLAVDPQLEVFRRLVAGEVTPIVRDVTIRPGVQVVPVQVDAAALAAVRQLADAVLSSHGPPVPAAQRDAARPAAVFAIATPQALARALGLQAPELPAVPDATAWVWAQASGDVPTLFVCAAGAQALQALVRPLPHYGREGWLVFTGSRLAAKGNWPEPTANALSAQAP